MDIKKEIIWRKTIKKKYRKNNCIQCIIKTICKASRLLSKWNFEILYSNSAFLHYTISKRNEKE